MSFDNFSDYQNDSDLGLIEIGYMNAAVALLFMIIGILWNGLVIAVILRKMLPTLWNATAQPGHIANFLLCLQYLSLLA